MTGRYRCPISACSWFTEQVASSDGPELPADPFSWTRPNWADVADRLDRAAAVVKTVNAHLASHTPLDWMSELARERRKTEAVTADRDRLAALPNLTNPQPEECAS